MKNFIVNLNINNHTIQYKVYVTYLRIQELTSFVNVKKYYTLCKTGCINYNQKWSCPPCSPDFISYTHKFNNIFIIMLQTDISNFNYIKNSYLKIKAANSILKSRLEKTVRSFMSKDTHYILSGSCRLCKPCKKKINQKCVHPDKMSYSFEALGINVSELVKNCFQIELQWYSKNNLPEYTCVVGGIISNSYISEDIIFQKLLELN